jgi:hypothetical protein
MTEPLVDRLIQSIGQAAELYHRLVMLVAPGGSGKTAALQEVRERTAAPLFNVNLELSLRMLDLTERQRALQLPRLFGEILGASITDVVLLDNIEILFDVSLKQDPLRLLQGLSRNKTVVAAWSGFITGENMVYATPDHAEYRRYPARDLIAMNRTANERQSTRIGLLGCERGFSASATVMAKGHIQTGFHLRGRQTRLLSAVSHFFLVPGCPR